MNSVTVKFANEKYNYSTSINGTNEEVARYFLNKWFNLGSGGKDNMQKCIAVDFEMNLHEVTARMLHIENVNMQYNKETNFGEKPNGQEKEIEKLLAEWDSLKIQRSILKQSK